MPQNLYERCSNIGGLLFALWEFFCGEGVRFCALLGFKEGLCGLVSCFFCLACGGFLFGVVGERYLLVCLHNFQNSCKNFRKNEQTDHDLNSEV